jgi:hypothetical protein
MVNEGARATHLSTRARDAAAEKNRPKTDFFALRPPNNQSDSPDAAHVGAKTSVQARG